MTCEADAERRVGRQASDAFDGDAFRAGTVSTVREPHITDGSRKYGSRTSCFAPAFPNFSYIRSTSTGSSTQSCKHCPPLLPTLIEPNVSMPLFRAFAHFGVFGGRISTTVLWPCVACSAPFSGATFSQYALCPSCSNDLRPS